MKYELVNPSDEIYFDAPSDSIAFFCALVVGGGAYAAKRTDTGEVIGGFYLLGIEQEAVAKELGEPVEPFIEANHEAINACFRSFRYIRERSSMNRIVDYAHGCRVKGAVE